MPAPTSERILSSAEELFAEQGYERTTLREITRLAHVNLAAVNYHFYDKESLLLAVIRRRMQPIDRARLEGLAAAEAAAAPQPVPLSVVLDLLARPLFELASSAEPGGRYVARLVGRSLIEPLPELETWLEKEFQPVLARFGQALRRHAPSLAPQEFLWRLSLVVGAMHHSLASLHRMKALTHGICADDDGREALRHFVVMAAGALTPGTADR